MKPLLTYVAGLMMLVSCSNHPSKGNVTDSTHLTRDSSVAGNEDTIRFNIADYQTYTVRHVGTFTITLLRYKSETDTKAILLLKDGRSGKTDTLMMGAIETLGESDHFAVRDVSKQLGGAKPSFLVDWQGDSDAIEEELIGYENNRLKELVNLPIVGGLGELKRIDEHTLEGTYSARDELIGYSRDGYRLRISLPDYETTEIEPDTAIFNDDTQTKDTIRTIRILPGKPEGVLYTILPGTPVHIDTFFRKMQIVRFHVGDSIFLRAPQEDVQGKFKGDDAG
jgi:hypothetical protein